MSGLRRRLRGGISPAITTIILVLVAVAVGAAVYVFVSPMMHPTITKVELMSINAKTSADGKALVVTADVRNSGTVPVNITGVTVMEGNTALSLSWTPKTPYTLAPSGEVTLTGTATALSSALKGSDQLIVTVTYVDPSGVQKSETSIVTVQQVM